MQNKSFVTIKVNKAEVTPDATVELDFDITTHIPSVKAQRMVVYAMIIEGTTHGNSVSSSEKNFHYVNMAFATPVEGEASFFTQDKPSNYTYTVDMKNTHVEQLNDLQVVIFVQDPTDKYIYQSACVKMGEGEPMAVEDDELAQSVSYTQIRAHETVLDIVCRLIL